MPLASEASRSRTWSRNWDWNSTVHSLILLEEAQRDLAALDPQVARRITKRLQWLGDHFEQIHPEALTGELADRFKFRVGDYRALYKIAHVEKTLVVYRVRHRREVYQDK